MKGFDLASEVARETEAYLHDQAEACRVAEQRFDVLLKEYITHESKQFAFGGIHNLLMTIGWAVIMKLAMLMPPNLFTLPLSLMAEAGITVNIVLMVLNLLPILPLDGGRIAVSLLPNRLALGYARLEPLGFPILLILLFTNVLGAILLPMVQGSIRVVETLFQL